MRRMLVVGVCLTYVPMVMLNALLPAPARAGEEGPVLAGTPPAILDPVVVTGTPIEIPMSELPAAITVIDREQIESRQATDVLELLRTVPGLGVAQTGSRGGVTRVFPRGGNPNFNLILVDGVPVNNAGGDFDFSDLTTTNVERIEIIRGPQSALYGSNAIGSVIQIFTRRGHGPLQADMSLQGGSFNTFEGLGEAAGGSDRLGASLGVGYVSTTGILSVNNDYRNLTLSSGLDYQPIEALKLAFSARYSDSHFENPTEGDGNRFGPLDPDEFQDRRRLLLSLRGTHAITPRWEQVLTLGLSRIDSVFVDPFNPPVDFSASRTTSDEQRLFLNYGWNVALPEFRQVAPTLSLGIEAQGESFDQRSEFGTSLSTVDRSRTQQGYYAQVLFNWRQQATLLAGVRVEDSSVFGVETNPRVAASYTLPWLQTRVRGGYATGIRAPTFIENFGTGSPFVVGNPNLQPEQSVSWEIGLDQPLLGGRALLGVTYFANTFTDLITFVSGVTPNYFNIQEAESSGIEAGLQVLFPWNLRLDGSYTFLETKVLDDGGVGETLFPPGQPLLRRPKHQGSIALTYLGEDTTVAVITNVVGDAIDRDFSRPGSPRVTLPGYTKVDVAASYTLARHLWGLRSVRLVGKIENLFDEDYEQPFGFSTAGFSIRGGVAVGF